MCKNKYFQSLGTKNELFKVQGRKPNFMQSLGTKTLTKKKKKNDEICF
jgi:hypothetical protein